MQVPSVMIPDDRPTQAMYFTGERPKRRVFLGRVRPKARPQAVRLSRFLSPYASGATPPPATVDYATKAAAAIAHMYLNDQEGDCVIAGKFHQLGVWSANDSDSGGIVTATDGEVQAAYSKLKAGPGDSGCVITDVLDYFKANGLTAGGKVYKIDGYVAIDWTNKLEVMVALYLFGSLTVGVNLPSAWTEGGNGSTWDVTNTRIVGGHDICAVGYNSLGVVIATWGGLRTISWAAFTSRNWVEEVYAQLAPEWYGNDKLSPCGVDVGGLRDALAALSAGNIPPIDPTPPPTPPTPPAPPTKPVVVIPDQVITVPHWFGSVPVTIPGGTYDVQDAPKAYLRNEKTGDCEKADHFHVVTFSLRDNQPTGNVAGWRSGSADPKQAWLDYLWIAQDVIPIVTDAIAMNWGALASDLSKFIADWRLHFPTPAAASRALGFGKFVTDVEKLIADVGSYLPHIEAIGATVIADVKAIALDLNIPWPFGASACKAASVTLQQVIDDVNALSAAVDTATAARTQSAADAQAAEASADASNKANQAESDALAKAQADLAAFGTLIA